MRSVKAWSVLEKVGHVSEGGIPVPLRTHTLLIKEWNFKVAGQSFIMLVTFKKILLYHCTIQHRVSNPVKKFSTNNQMQQTFHDISSKIVWLVLLVVFCLPERKHKYKHPVSCENLKKNKLI